jgi:hypothetical protein
MKELVQAFLFIVTIYFLYQAQDQKEQGEEPRLSYVLAVCAFLAMIFGWL